MPVPRERVVIAYGREGRKTSRAGRAVVAAAKGLRHAVQDSGLLQILHREHTPGNETSNHGVLLWKIRNDFRPDAQFCRRASTGDFTRAVDAEQRGVLAGYPQHVTLAVRVDAIVAIGEAAAERRHVCRSAAQCGDELDQLLFVHNIAFLSPKLAAGKPRELARWKRYVAQPSQAVDGGASQTCVLASWLPKRGGQCQVRREMAGS